MNIRFGIIGSSSITESFLAAAKHEPRFELKALYSRTQAKGEEFCTKHKIPYLYTSPEAMASDTEIDAVYIASPNAMHASHAITMMQHGKHVLCEKPIASNADELRTMIATAQEYGVVLMEAMRPTMNPNFKQIQNVLSRIGKVRRYFAQYCQYSSRYDSLKEGSLPNAFNRDLSNGALMDIGIYCIYPMIVLFGSPHSFSAQSTLLHTGVDGQGSLILNYGDMDAVVMYSKISNSSLHSEIQGEEGTICINRINKIVKVTIEWRNGTIEDITQPTNAFDMYYEIAAFIDAIGAGAVEAETNTHAASLATLSLIDSIRQTTGINYPADTKVTQ